MADYTITKNAAGYSVAPPSQTFPSPPPPVDITFENTTGDKVRLHFSRKDGGGGWHCFDKDDLDIDPGQIGTATAKRNTDTTGEASLWTAVPDQPPHSRQTFDINF